MNTTHTTHKPPTITALTARIDAAGVRLTTADRDLVLSRKGAPKPEDTDRVAAWAAIAALVRIGRTQYVADRMAYWGDTFSIHPAHVADIITTDPRTPRVTIDTTFLTDVGTLTDKQVTNMPTTLNNLFRLHTRNGHQPRFGDRIGASCAVSWVRVDGPTFTFIANA
jgi:hypothetical protein